MLQSHHVFARIRHHALAVCGLRSGPLPRSAMLRSGSAIGGVFVLFLVFGRPEAAIIGAFFTNFLCLADKADHVTTRVRIQVAGAAIFVALGTLGVLIGENAALLLVVVFAFALIAGAVHGTSPGAEALPRFGLCCLIVTAFIPIDHADGLSAALLGAAVSVATVLLDDYVRHGRRGAYIKRIRADVKYPGPRFSLVYGFAAVCAMAIGLVWAEIRPYWVTVTTLLVMQSDRRANTVRVVQRFLGTLAGVVAAFAIVQALPDAAKSQSLLALAVTLPFVWPLGFDRNYALGVAILCTWVLLLIDTALPRSDLVTPLFLARLSDTAIGCAVALVGSFAVFEVGTETAEQT